MALVINLFGGPGTGKSTTMARLFADLKSEGYNCEMVSEFAKDLVYENRIDTMKDELYIFAKQNHRLFRVEDKVDIIITDRPLLLTNVYVDRYASKDYDEYQFLANLVRYTFLKYNNVNILLERDIEYKANEGRMQNLEEAKILDIETKKHLKLAEADYQQIKTTDYDAIYNHCKEKIKNLL